MVHTIIMEKPPESFGIRHYGALGHSKSRIDGRMQETRVVDIKDKDEGQFTPAPVKVLVKNGVWLDEPEIIEYRQRSR